MWLDVVTAIEEGSIKYTKEELMRSQFTITEEPTTKIVSKNALPILAYYDIFKNYYANTQEENFYIIGNTEDLIITINGTEVNPNVIPSNEGRINNTGVITITPNTIKQNEVQIKVAKDASIGQSVILAPEDIGTWNIVGDMVMYRDWETDRKSVV